MFKNKRRVNDLTVLQDYTPIYMSIEKYRTWFDALVTDDLTSANHLLENAGTEEKYLLVNCPFSYDVNYDATDKSNTRQEQCLKMVVMPFHLAVSYNSQKIAKLLLESKAKVSHSNTHGNVLHSCVVTSFSRPGLQDAICESVTWLSGQISEEEFTKLLFQENDDNLRPLEFAAQQGCLKLMRLMLHMKGHVEVEKSCALLTYRYHDVTEYELGERHHKSPINMLVYLDKTKMKQPEVKQIIADPLISTWINAKLKSNIIPVLGMMIFRVFYVMLYMFLSLDSSKFRHRVNITINASYPCTDLLQVTLDSGVSRTLHVMLFIISLLSIALELIQMFKSGCGKHKLKKYDLNGAKTMVTSTSFYTWINMCLTLAILLTTTSNLITSIKANTTINLIRHLAQNVTPILCLWTVCNFLQLLPQIGSSIVSIQGMVVDVLEFMLLYGLVLLPFVHVFETFVLFNSKQGCIDEFSSPYQTAYTLFRMMLNMVDLTLLKVKHSGVLYMLHALYIFMVAVMLLNFLIAIMSSSASRITENENVILKVNQLALVVKVEDLIYSFSRWFYRKSRKWGFCCQGDKVYIRSITCRLAELRGINKGMIDVKAL